MKDGITKQQTKMLYGIAILFMLYHHLFGMPNKIKFEYFSLLGNYEINIAWFCKICVAIYAFISGYGLCKTANKKNVCDDWKTKLILDYKYCLKHLLSFMEKYWIVFVIFVPIGFIFFHIKFDISDFVLSLGGLSRHYSGAWWYIKSYIIMMIMFPIINMVFAKGTLKRHCISIGVMLLMLVLGTVIDLINIYHLIFIVGFICARFFVFEKIEKNMPSKWTRLILCWTFLLVCVAIRMVLSKNVSYNQIDIIIIVPFIYTILSLLHSEKVNKVLEMVGKYSTYMWLTHTFYCYSYFQDIIGLGHYSVLIYIELIALSLLTSIILEYLEKAIKTIFMKFKGNLNIKSKIVG